ncbi:hypothetical protein [Escherichia coli]|uniref:hypothetical protein n=1 Tax=Escherichia coli TaxID=562 RepID=UPI00107428AB|nr:hypothetical protein [Escherichia coli]TFP38921.1 hypothetical protein ELV08_14295 [Escherichia coli]
MKQMTLIEMDGFLKGKCIPRDLKVNETNAEYLVRKFAEAEAKCAALAAENAGLKSSVTQQIELRAEIKKAGRPPHADFWVQSICEAEEKVKRALEETPATDAFLAEVRAQGVEMAMEHMQSSGSLTFGDCYISLNEFAAQLRKGGNQ